jgi:anion-transporting  ArsA/GET3 family ATPase
VVKLLVYTGSPGAGISMAAAAEAARAADAGKRTLLLTYGSTAGLGALLGVAIGSVPVEVAPRLNALALDARSELAAAWEETRATLLPPFSNLAGDELPQPPASDAAFALLRIRDLAPNYDRVVVDAGPHDPLIEALGVPDNLRWIARLLIGLDGQPAQGSLLPGLLLPPEFVSNLRRVLVEAERLRNLLDAPASMVCYVLRPDAAALAEARLAIPAIQLHGVAVGALVAGPLLPPNPEDARLAPLERLQAALLDEAAAIWSARPLLRLDMSATAGGHMPLLLAGRAMGDAGAVTVRSPIGNDYRGEPALTFELPGLPQGAIGLTLSGDDLIVRVGSYRRHVPLPSRLRGVRAVRATREGDLLVVRRR